MGIKDFEIKPSLLAGTLQILENTKFPKIKLKEVKIPLSSRIRLIPVFPYNSLLTACSCLTEPFTEKKTFFL